MYKYLSTSCQETTVINKSRFICLLFPCNSKAEVKAQLQQLKVQHPKADHYCYAYLLDENKIQKYSDDGEPAKTAGWPMLDVLLKNNMDDILAVVVRYFGGIKLGAGGLSKAYRSCVATALKNCELFEKIEVPLYQLTVDYHQSDQVKNFLAVNCTLLAVNYKEKVEFSFYCLQTSVLSALEELNVGFNQKIYTLIKIVKS